MANSEFQLDAPPPGFEIPEAKPVDVKPAVAPQRFDQGAGFMGKAGVGAAIGASILEGWIQGTRIKEERMREQARDKLSGARSMYAMSVENWQKWRLGNPTPDAQKDPQGFAQWQQKNKEYQNAASVAKNTYADTMQPYVIHEEPKGKGVGGKLKSAGKRLERGFTAQQPQMFAEGVLNSFRQMPIDQLGQPNPEAVAQLGREKKLNELTDLEIGEKKQQAAEHAEEKQKVDAATAVLEKPESASPQQLTNAKNTLRVKNNQEPKTTAEFQADEQKARQVSAESKAAADIEEKFNSGKPLTPQEQRFHDKLHGIKGEWWEAFDDLVGTPDGPKTLMQARLMALKFHAAHAGQGAPTATQAMNSLLAGRWLESQGLDDTPEARQGVLSALKFNSLEVDKDGKIVKASKGGGKSFAERFQQEQEQRDQAIQAALMQNPKWSWFTTSIKGKGNNQYHTFSPWGAKDTARVLDPENKGKLKDVNSPFFEPHWKIMGGDKSSTMQEYGKFLDAVEKSLRDQGASDEEIKKMMPARPLAPTPEGGDRTQRKFTPSSSAVRSGYRVTKGNQTLNLSDLSDDEIKKLKAKGYSVERSQ